MKNAERSESRRNEILDVAESLFSEKGYEYTTINDILQVSGFSKGSLYYHYKFKQEVLDGIIQRRGDASIAAARQITDADIPDIREKLLLVLVSLQPGDEQQRNLTQDIEQSSNGQMFIKSLSDIIQRIAPVLKDIIDQGIAAGVFSTPYPLESVEILLSAAHALLDNGELNWTPNEKTQRFAALILAAERTLGAEAGSLTKLTQLAH